MKTPKTYTMIHPANISPAASPRMSMAMSHEPPYSIHKQGTNFSEKHSNHFSKYNQYWGPF